MRSASAAPGSPTARSSIDSVVSSSGPPLRAGGPAPGRHPSSFQSRLPKSSVTPSPPGWHDPLANGSLESLAARGIQRSYRRGVILIHQGDPGGSLYLIRQGQLRVFLSDRRGREFTLGVYGPGECVGEMSLDGGPRSASVMTVERTDCAIVERDVLLDFIRTHPEFALQLMSRIIRRARLATESAGSLALLDVYSRFAQLLERLSVDGPDGRRHVPDKLTQQAIAERIGASREMVSRVMKDLTTAGFLHVESGRIVIARPLPAGW